MRHREMRIPCDTELTVLLGGEARRGRFVNISRTGARLEGLGRLPREAPVTLSHLGVRIGARVVWSNDRQAGLRFLVPLTEVEVNGLRGTGKGGAPNWRAQGHHGFRELT